MCRYHLVRHYSYVLTLVPGFSTLLCYDVLIGFIVPYVGRNIVVSAAFINLALQQSQQAIMGGYSIHGDKCAFAYSWKGQSPVLHRELPAFCRGSTKGWAPSCWCMVLVLGSVVFSIVYAMTQTADHVLLWSTSFYHLWQISFQPLVQCLDIDNLIKLFTAVLLERRTLLRSNKYVFSLFS